MSRKIFSERERKALALSLDKRISTVKKLNEKETALAAKDGDFDSGMSILEGLIAASLMGSNPETEYGTFLGGATWMARQIHDMLCRFDRVEFGVTPLSMMPVVGLALEVSIFDGFLQWKRERTIEIEDNPVKKKLITQTEAEVRRVYEEMQKKKEESHE